VVYLKIFHGRFSLSSTSITDFYIIGLATLALMIVTHCLYTARSVSGNIQTAVRPAEPLKPKIQWIVLLVAGLVKPSRLKSEHEHDHKHV
jgi:hypothetical protein